jgi:CRP/FNR family transcriptional regulator, cyclic AMP receptor protein
VPLIPNSAAFEKSFATLPTASFHAGETVFLAGSRTGRLLILKKGAVAVIKDGVEIANVSEPGAVFGELSILLDQPHTADVRALQSSEFYLANESLLAQDQPACIYIATVLARRVNNANRALIELKRQLHAGEPQSGSQKPLPRSIAALSTPVTHSIPYRGIERPRPPGKGAAKAARRRCCR